MALSFGTNRLLALDWDRKTLRLVLVRPRADGVDLLKAVSVAIPPDVRTDDAASLGAFVREAMQETHVSAKKALLAIPRDQVVLNTLNLPPTPAAEMPALIQFQVVKELPFSAEQATIDFAVSGEFDPKSAGSVLVAAVRNEELAFYKRVAEQAGLIIERIGLRPFANLIAVTAKAPDLMEKALLIVEVGPHLTEIDIVREGHMLFSRAASVMLPEQPSVSVETFKDSRVITTRPREREEDDDSRQAVSDLMVEIVRSVEAYRATDPSLSLDHVVVCGATGLETMLAQALGARFATLAELYKPDRAMDIAPDRARELRGFNATVGLAIGHGHKGLSFIDFLHPKKPVSKRSVQLRKVPTLAATVALFVGSVVTFHYKFIKPKMDEVKRLETEKARLKKQEEPILKFKEQVEALERWIDAERHWPEVLASLTEIFPPETEGYVTRLDLEMVMSPKAALREAGVRVRFRTASMGEVNKLAAKMREAGFDPVNPGKETAAEVSRDGYKWDTNIDAGVPLRKAEPVEENPAHAPEIAETKEPTASPNGAASVATSGRADG